MEAKAWTEIKWRKAKWGNYSKWGLQCKQQTAKADNVATTFYTILGELQTILSISLNIGQNTM